MPSEALIAELGTQTPAGTELSTSLVLASGAPDGFDQSASLLLENLLKLQSGTATISDTASTLTGVPADPSVVESVLVAMKPGGTTRQSRGAQRR